MSRTAQALNRLELAARKLGMSVEDALSILEGQHPAHIVTVRPASAQEPFSAPKEETASEDSTEEEKEVVEDGEAEEEAAPKKRFGRK